MIEAGAFATLPDDRIAVGTRRGDVYFITGIDEPKPDPAYHLFATGLDEIFGLALEDDALYVTQSCELTRVTDTNGDGRADRFETVSDAWGYANYHEYAFGSKFDAEGNLYVALGLSASYHSRALFRGWALQVTPDGRVDPDRQRAPQPGWHRCQRTRRALLHREPGAVEFLVQPEERRRPAASWGIPISFNWYAFAPHMGPAPDQPKSGSRILTEKKRIPQLDPYAVIFPYIRMGRSISGFTIDRTGGQVRPVRGPDVSRRLHALDHHARDHRAGQRGVAGRVLSVPRRAVDRHPERPVHARRAPPLRRHQPRLAGARHQAVRAGANRVDRASCRSRSSASRSRPRASAIGFTKPVDADTGANPASYAVTTFTHIYHGAYGGPEVDQTTPTVRSVSLAADGLSATIVLDELLEGHVHEFDLEALRARDAEELLHHDAYYTVNEIPRTP